MIKRKIKFIIKRIIKVVEIITVGSSNIFDIIHQETFVKLCDIQNF